MTKLIYSVRDDLNGFGSLFLAPSDGFAKRDFSAAVNGNVSSSALAFSPDDFALYRLGKFNDETGSFDLEPVPVMICRGGALLVKRED